MASVWIVPFAVIGLIVSAYIFYKKRKKEALVCKIGTDCNIVLFSKYSTMFGIPNEVLGILYYLFVLVVFGLVAAGVTHVLVSLSLLLVIVSAVAAAFSVVLFYIQGFVLKEWCEYCLVSIFATIAIFLIELIV